MTEDPAAPGSPSEDADPSQTSTVYHLSDTAGAEALARQVAEMTWELKALNTKVLDVRGLVSYTDFLVITSGTSERQVRAVAKHIESELSEPDRQPVGDEGLESGDWAIVDFGDVVLHVFQTETRKDYQLEQMWPRAETLPLEDRPSDLYGHFAVEQLG